MTMLETTTGVNRLGYSSSFAASPYAYEGPSDDEFFVPDKSQEQMILRLKPWIFGLDYKPGSEPFDHTARKARHDLNSRNGAELRGLTFSLDNCAFGDFVARGLDGIYDPKSVQPVFVWGVYEEIRTIFELPQVRSKIRNLTRFETAFRKIPCVQVNIEPEDSKLIADAAQEGYTLLPKRTRKGQREMRDGKYGQGPDAQQIAYFLQRARVGEATILGTNDKGIHATLHVLTKRDPKLESMLGVVSTLPDYCNQLAIAS